MEEKKDTNEYDLFHRIIAGKIYVAKDFNDKLGRSKVIFRATGELKYPEKMIMARYHSCYTHDKRFLKDSYCCAEFMNIRYCLDANMNESAELVRQEIDNGKFWDGEKLVDIEKIRANVISILAGCMKFAIETQRILGTHDFDADIAGTNDTYEKIAEDYLKQKEPG